MLDSWFYKIPTYCKCNLKGLCKNCSCSKSNNLCINCLPLRAGHCYNQSHSGSLICPPCLSTTSDPDDVANDVASSTHKSPSESLVTWVFSSPIPVSDGFSLGSDHSDPGSDPVTRISISSDHVSSQLSSVPNLPQFTVLEAPSFFWGNHTGRECCLALSECYDEAIHWRHNLFKVPSGRAGNLFVRELTRLFTA